MEYANKIKSPAVILYGENEIKSGKPKPLASDTIKWINFEEIKNYAFPKATLKLFDLLNDS